MTTIKWPSVAMEEFFSKHSSLPEWEVYLYSWSQVILFLIELIYLVWAAQLNRREGLKNVAGYTGTDVPVIFFVIGSSESVVFPWLFQVGAHHHDVLMIWASLKKTSCFTTKGVYENEMIHLLWSFENEGWHIFFNGAKLLKTPIEKSAVRSFLLQRL